MDQNSHGLCMLFGCAPEVWQDVMSEYHAFSERIGQEVSLRPLTDEHIADLVSDYLKLARIDDEDGTWPFEQECIELIHQQSQGNIRQALSLCSRVLDAGIDNNQEQVTAEFVQSVLTH